MGILDLFLPTQSENADGTPNLRTLAVTDKPTDTGYAGLDLMNKYSNSQNQQAAAQTKQDVIQNAISLYKSGDVKGAFATMSAVAPEKLAGDLSGLANGQALSQGKQTGELQAQKNFGSTPLELIQEQNKGSLANAKVKAEASDWVIKKDGDSPSGFVRVNKRTNEKQFVNMQGDPIGVPDSAPKGSVANPAPVDPSNPQAKPAAPKLRPNQDIGSDGSIITLTPNQEKTIKETRKSFDSDTKDIVKALDSAQKSLDYIHADIPATKTLETIVSLKAALGSGRINAQEFTAYGKGMGLVQTLDQAITEAKGKKAFSPDMKQNFKAMAELAASVLSKEYEQHLNNTVERTREVDPAILKKRLMGSGPTFYQKIANQVNQLEPDLQAAYNQAHDGLYSDDPAVKAKAEKAMGLFRSKYKIGQ